jgi:hypothetical protein
MLYWWMSQWLMVAAVAVDVVAAAAEPAILGQ